MGKKNRNKTLQPDSIRPTGIRSLQTPRPKEQAPLPLALGALIEDLLHRPGAIAISTVFLGSAAWVIYAGGLAAALCVFFSSLWALYRLTGNRG